MFSHLFSYLIATALGRRQVGDCCCLVAKVCPTLAVAMPISQFQSWGSESHMICLQPHSWLPGTRHTRVDGFPWVFYPAPTTLQPPDFLKLLHSGTYASWTLQHGISSKSIPFIQQVFIYVLKRLLCARHHGGIGVYEWAMQIKFRFSQSSLTVGKADDKQ